jgi:hypothetical protein
VTAVSHAAAPRAAVPPRALATPRILRGLLIVIVGAAALQFVVAWHALAAERAALRVISHDTAPSILMAQEISVQLADLDAQLADSLIGTAAEREVAQELFELRRSMTTKRLVDAADNITFGDAERTPILAMSEDLGRYLELAAQAQWLFERGDREASLSLLRVATNTMHGRILPSADALDRANRGPLDSEYSSAQGSAWLYQVQAIAAGVLLVGAMVAAQVFVRRRMRRRIVPALLAATIVGAWSTVHVLGRVGHAREDLRIARDDAFNSMHLLWRARALAYDARGDQARWLLDRPRAAYFETEFRTKVRQITSHPEQALTAQDAESGRVTGILAEEFHLLTFAGEAAAAAAIASSLVRYNASDAAMRELERQGRHEDASEVCVGGRDDASGALFDRVDEALQRTIGINEEAFGQVIASADRGLAQAEWVDPVIAIALALLGWLGLRGRLREYA